MCVFRNVIILIYYAFYFILCYFNCYSVTNPSDISEGGILNQILLAHCCAGWVDPPPPAGSGSPTRQAFLYRPGVDGAQALAEALRGNSALQHLNLAGVLCMPQPAAVVSCGSGRG